jgi:hypothetical protein
MRRAILLLSILFISILTQAQTAKDLALAISANYVQGSGMILTWENDTDPGNFLLYRLDSSGSWGSPIASLPSGDTTYTDTIGPITEYRISKVKSGYTREGYVKPAINTSVDNNGLVILVVVDSLYQQLPLEVNRFVTDLENERGKVALLEVSESWTPQQVKFKIDSVYVRNRNSSKTVILLGHVPVPYSGNIAPDGHTNNHLGAWPADGYYGEMDGNWTDNSVNSTVSPARTQNVPGDGKFDQNTFPSDVDLMVGRIDFSNLPNFNKSEIQLTKEYLDRNHTFRTKQWVPKQKALIDDNFGYFGGEGFAANGWRNFPLLVGRENIYSGDIRAQADTGSYLWTLGCGAGSYTSCNGVGTSVDFAGDSLNTVFAMLFGSYFGDWDVSNNLMRTYLAQGTTLGICWAGRPNFYFHYMARGSSIGECIRLSMNNQNLYEPNVFAKGVHMAYLGDPTLRQSYVAPPQNLNAIPVGQHVELNWDPSPEQVEGYLVYRKNLSRCPNCSYQFVAQTNNLNYVDSCISDSALYSYLVRARKTEYTQAGFYINESYGARADTIVRGGRLFASFSIQVVEDTLFITNNSQGATNYSWSFGDGELSNEFEPIHIYDNIGNYTVVMVASNDCDQETRGTQVQIQTIGFDYLSENMIHIFPNPEDDLLNVKIQNEFNNGQLSLYNTQGKLVLRQDLNGIG